MYSTERRVYELEAPWAEHCRSQSGPHGPTEQTENEHRGLGFGGFVFRF